MTSVCNDDLTPSLSSFGYAAGKLVGDPCIDAVLEDTSPDPGIQPLCVVSDQASATSGGTRVPECSGTTTKDCWQVVADATTCPNTPNHMRLVVDRTAMPPPNVYTSARCLTRN